MKEVLAAIWKHGHAGRSAGLEDIISELRGCGRIEIEKTVAMLKNDGFIKDENGGFVLTEKGREQIKVVVCGGVFDILHPGHAFILSEARSLGDVLVVIVARDSTVEKRKRIPIVPEDQRVEMVSQLKPVDVVFLGYEGDPLKIIEDLRPDIIALGPDQHHDEERIKREMGKRGVALDVKRIKEYKECDLNSTKAILQRIIERGYPDSREGG